MKGSQVAPGRFMITFDRPKNFCTRLAGDAGAVFATLEQAFLRFGAPEAHVALDITVSANSPSRR